MLSERLEWIGHLAQRELRHDGPLLREVVILRVANMGYDLAEVDAAIYMAVQDGLIVEDCRHDRWIMNA